MTIGPHLVIHDAAERSGHRRVIMQPMKAYLRTACSGVLGAVATVILSASLAEFAAAQSRAETTRMTCDAARALVTRNGAVVLGTGSSRYDPNAPALFGRYVVSQAYCYSTQTTEPAFVPTTDNRQCFVGYTCRERRSNFPF